MKGGAVFMTALELARLRKTCVSVANALEMVADTNARLHANGATDAERAEAEAWTRFLRCEASILRTASEET